MKDIIIRNYQFSQSGLEELNNKKEEFISDYPVVYMLYNDNSAYIGETVSLKNRMKQHLKNPDRKKFTKMLVIGYERFNKSATYNIESNLINYCLADEKFSLQNISQTTMRYSHNYYDKNFFNKEFFKYVWLELRKQNLALEGLESIENKDIFKLSPLTALSEDQVAVKDELLAFCEEKLSKKNQGVFVVKGEAGTGKSVLLSATFHQICKMSQDKSSPLYGTSNYLLVNHPEMLKTYKDISKEIPLLKANQFYKPTTFINQLNKEQKQADIVFIDEAHLLLSKPDPYNNFKQSNHLAEIIKKAKVVVIIYDAKQVLKLKSYWDDKLLKKVIKENSIEVTEYDLKEQLRMQVADEVIDWIDKFTAKELAPLPQVNDYDFQIFSSLEEMHQAIKRKNIKYGLSRIVSTFDYEHKKDGADYFVSDNKGYSLPWNRSYKTTWAEVPTTIDEVGSIYTIQGFDLNYVGVNLGPSVVWKDGVLAIRTDKYQDREAYRANNEVGIVNIESEKEKIVLNSINVLMKRGVKGLYIHAHNKELAEKLKELNHNLAII